MATYLSLVNEVLRRLREDEVTTVSDTAYSELIGDFLNQIKEEMEDATSWNALRSTIQVTTVGDSTTFRYSLTGTGQRSLILDVWNDTEDMWLRKRSSQWLTARLNTVPVDVNSAIYYGINGIDSSGDIYVDTYPVTSTTETLNFNMVVPEAILSVDTDETSMPRRALVLGAWALAIDERGEDGGVSFTKADARYRAALSDAIAIDASYFPDEFIMEVV